MSTSRIENILTLAHNRLLYLENKKGKGFYRGPETFFDGILDEMEEVKIELDQNKKVYLEDELGDVYWDYVCLLESLELQGKIDTMKVFERCYTKYSERLNPDGSDNGDWAEVKLKQKERLYQQQISYEKV